MVKRKQNHHYTKLWIGNLFEIGFPLTNYDSDNNCLTRKVLLGKKMSIVVLEVKATAIENCGHTNFHDKFGLLLNLSS